MSFLGIDLGTSGLRALLVDAAGQPVGSAEAHYAVQHPHPGWSEQDPDGWWSATCAAVREAIERSGHGATELAGVGLSGPEETVQPLSLTPI